jgi:hypothetical protein
MHASLLPQLCFSQDEPTLIPRLQSAGKVDMLIPGFLYSAFEFLKTDPGSLNYLFRLMTARYRNRILRQGCKVKPRSGKASPDDSALLRTRYQLSGLGLRRVSFPVEEELWVELRLLSLATRCSMSLLMVQMVLWEYARRTKFARRNWDPVICGQVGTPTLHRLTLCYNNQTRLFRITGYFSESWPARYPPWFTALN